MIYKHNFTLPEELAAEIADQGFEFLPELLRLVINAAMQMERQKYLGVEPYERGPERRDQANGYKPKTMKTRVGDITFEIPQVREGDFYPQALEKGLRSERALVMSLAEMYIQGVSTRKVAAIIKQLCGSNVSSSLVSRAAAQMDEQLTQWRNSPLGEIVYLYLDARYEKVRQDGQVRDTAVLIAVGVGTEGHRKVLGVSASLGEQETHWRTFMENLVKRGLRGVQLIISDDHAGLNAARKAVFGGVPWQRCQFHLQQNAQAYVPHKEMQLEVAEALRTVFNAPDRPTAERYLADAVKKYEKSASRLATWMEQNVPEGLTCFSFPAAHRRSIRTSNPVERLNREVKRRTRVVGIFPNEASCLRLVSAILMEISDEWEAGRVYLSMPAPGST